MRAMVHLGLSILLHAALSNSSFYSKRYPADAAGSTAWAAWQNSTAPSNANSFWLDFVGWTRSPISSRASQNAAALLFDLGTVDVR
jgi:hypothetical protein